MLQTKALYNLLRLNAKEDPTLQVESWALENLREASFEELWEKLATLKVSLNSAHFKEFAKECDSPEMLTDLLLDETQEERYDELYLIVFELWRRLFPEKISLSIFCDELDHQIDRYDRGEMENDEPIQDGLANLSEILEEHVDLKMSPKEAFAALSEYFATDLATFLYDYITELLDQENTLYASELIEEFAPFIPDPLRFDCLEARLFSFTDVMQANQQIKLLLDKPLDTDLLFEVLILLAAFGVHDLFLAAIKKLLPQLTEEEEMEDMMDLTVEYYRRLDLDELAEAVLRIKQKRPFDLEEFQKLVFSSNILLA